MRSAIAVFVTPMVLLALLAGVSASGGYILGAAKVETLRTEHASALFAASQSASRALYAAQQRGDALTLQLAAASATAHQITQARQHEVATVTTGRACLGEPALRLLDGAPGLSVQLPAPRRRAADPHAAHAAPLADLASASDTHVTASDTHVTAWALAAGAQYAECARRLDALIGWHATTADGITNIPKDAP